MFKVVKITLNSPLASLIGFAKKSRALERGFEAVRRGMEKKKVAFVLIDETLAENSLKKITALARQFDTPVLLVQKGENSNLLEGTGYKILGMHPGGLAQGFVDKLKQENQWL